MKVTYFVLLSFIPLLLFSCGKPKERLIIALSKGAGGENYEKYEKWLKNFDSDIVCIDLFFIDRDSAMKVLEMADGVVLTGGPDVHPSHYGRPDDAIRCKIDAVRDTLEFEIIHKAREIGLPILGICRGAQILNVALGGSLIVDIPEDTDSDVIHQMEGADAEHEINIDIDSKLFDITGELRTIVNSNHHQAVDVLATDFVASAVTSDGIIEAFEYANPGSRFLIAVQWHPERMDFNSPLSGNIAREFIKYSRSFKAEKIKPIM